MRRSLFGRGSLAVLAALAWLVSSPPLLAQSTGMLKGKVVDGQGQPVEGAQVVIESSESGSRHYEVKTNKKGEFVQIGLQSATYHVTASKDKVGSQTFDVRVRLGSPAEVNFVLQPGSGGPAMTREEAAKIEAFKKVFDAGVAASTAGNFDEAIARYNEAAGIRPDCYACAFNIGGAYTQKKEYDKAEEAFKKAMTLKPDAPEPYNALANVYSAQKRFDDAAKMTEEATKRAASGATAGAGDADALFNQGVVFWNAGRIADAKKQFEAALQANPQHAEAHYWVGMANLNEGKLPDAATQFDEYLKLAPTGQYADQAKGILAQIKK